MQTRVSLTSLARNPSGAMQMRMMSAVWSWVILTVTQLTLRMCRAQAMDENKGQPGSLWKRLRRLMCWTALRLRLPIGTLLALRFSMFRWSATLLHQLRLCLLSRKTSSSYALLPSAFSTRSRHSPRKIFHTTSRARSWSCLPPSPLNAHRKRVPTH